MTRRTALLSLIAASLAPLMKSLPIAKAAPAEPAPKFVSGLVVVRIGEPAKGGGTYHGTLDGSDVPVLALDVSGQISGQSIIGGTKLVAAYTGYLANGLPLYRVFTPMPLW